MMLRRIVIATLLLAGVFVQTGSNRAVAQDVPLIRVGTSLVEQAVPIFYAAKAGLYKAAGLNVDIQALPSASAVTAALVGGSLEIGRGSTSSAIIAIDKGIPLTLIGGNSYYDSRNPNVALVVAKDAGIKTAKDLEGKTLAATSLDDFNTLSTFEWLDKHGVDHALVKYVEIPPSATLAAIQQKRVVGSTLIEPFLSGALASGAVTALGYTYDAVSPRFSASAMFASSEWAATHGDVLRRFLQATREANTYIMAHPDESIAILSQSAGFDPNAFKAMKHSELTVSLTPAEVQPLIDTLAKYGALPKPLRAADIICSCAPQR